MPDHEVFSIGGTFTPYPTNLIEMDFPVSDGNGGLAYLSAACEFFKNGNDLDTINSYMNANAIANLAAYAVQIWDATCNVQTPAPGAIKADNLKGFGTLIEVGFG